MPTEKPRFTITVDEELLKAIDDFRFENRFENRTKAVIALMEKGIEAIKEQNANKNKE